MVGPCKQSETPRGLRLAQDTIREVGGDVMKSSREKQTIVDGYVFIAPAFIIIGVFVIFPALRLVYLSFYDANIMGREIFTGFGNFRKLFNSRDFIRSFTVTLRFMGTVVMFQTILAFIGALIVQSGKRSSSIIRTIFFIPVIISFVVVGYLWQGLYNHDYGLINSFITAFGGSRQGFLNDPSQALLSLIITCIWKSWPYFMMIFIAGLNEIPQELYESAQIDGATPFRQLWNITIPMLRRTILFILLITTMDSVVKVFTPVFVMTSGGPRGSTDLLVHYAWRMAFRFGDIGYASSVMVIVFLFLIVIGTIQIKVGEHHES